MRSVVILALGLLTVSAASAQAPVALKFDFLNAGQSFQLNETMPALNGVNYKVEAIAFFVSRVELIHDGGQTLSLDTNQVFYINFNDPWVSLGTFDLTHIEGIRFDVGVPQHLSHLDISQYPENHPLSYHDPSMHWGWSAGYTHVVVNGHGDDNNDGIPTAPYQLHCLGDDNVISQQVNTVATVYADHSQEVILNVNIDEWLRGTNPATTGAMHGSNGINGQVAHNPLYYPVFFSPLTAGVNEPKTQLQLLIAQQNKDVSVTWDASVKADNYNLVDAEGRTVSTGSCASGTLAFSGLTSGLHFIQLYSARHELLGSAKWIVP